MNTRNIFFLPLVFPAFFSFGQARFADGVVVTNEGDTLKGLVQQRESDLNPSEVNYKPSDQAPTKTFTVEEARYFSIPGVGSFQRFTLPISMDPVNLDEIHGYTAAPALRKTVFLKVLQRGKSITLLSYRDELKIRFYIIHSQSPEPQELVYKLIRNGANFAEVFSFRELLKFVGERAGVMTDKLKAQIKNTYYTERQILKVVSAINDIKVEKVGISDKASTGLRVGAGLNLARLHYYGSDEYAKNASSSPSALYWVSIGYDIAKNPYIGKMVFRGDITLSVAEFTTTTYDYRYSSELDITHSFTQRTISASVYGLYNIRNGQKLKFFVSVGARPNFSSYNNNFYELRRTSPGSVDIIRNKDSEPIKLWLSIPVKLGIVIRQKVEFGVMYSPNMVLSHGDFLYKYGINTMQAGLLYHF